MEIHIHDVHFETNNVSIIYFMAIFPGIGLLKQHVSHCVDFTQEGYGAIPISSICHTKNIFTVVVYLTNYICCYS